MTSPKRLARIAGILYLLVGIFGGFAEGFVDPRMYVAGRGRRVACDVDLGVDKALGKAAEDADEQVEDAGDSRKALG